LHLVQLSRGSFALAICVRITIGAGRRVRGGYCAKKRTVAEAAAPRC